MLARGLLRTSCRLALRQPGCVRPAAAPLAVRHFGGHGDPRAHLNPDGTRPEAEDGEDYHDPDPIEHMPKLNLVKERGQTFVVSGDPPKTAGEIWEDISQQNLPYWHRHRLYIWGNYSLIMKAEYLFFYIPTVLIFGLVIPLFTSIYAAEEVVASTMTVKVTGRQWYWVYEVESPTDDGDDDE